MAYSYIEHEVNLCDWGNATLDNVMEMLEVSEFFGELRNVATTKFHHDTSSMTNGCCVEATTLSKMFLG